MSEHGSGIEAGVSPVPPQFVAGMEACPVAIVVADQHGRLLGANERFADLADTRPRSHPDRHLDEAGRAKMSEDLLRPVFATGSPSTADLEIATSRGPRRTRW